MKRLVNVGHVVATLKSIDDSGLVSVTSTILCGVDTKTKKKEQQCEAKMT
jgi:hypothetical protein